MNRIILYTKHFNLDLFKAELFRKLELLLINQLLNNPKEVVQIFSDFIKTCK